MGCRLRNTCRLGSKLGWPTVESQRSARAISRRPARATQQVRRRFDGQDDQEQEDRGQRYEHGLDPGIDGTAGTALEQASTGAAVQASDNSAESPPAESTPARPVPGGGPSSRRTAQPSYKPARSTAKTEARTESQSKFPPPAANKSAASKPAATMPSSDASDASNAMDAGGAEESGGAGKTPAMPLPHVARSEPASRHRLPRRPMSRPSRKQRRPNQKQRAGHTTNRRLRFPRPARTCW